MAHSSVIVNCDSRQSSIDSNGYIGYVKTMKIYFRSESFELTEINTERFWSFKNDYINQVIKGPVIKCDE